MDITYRNNVFSVPSSWRDESLLTFTVPPPKTTPGQPSTGSPGNIVVEFYPAHRASPQDYLGTKLKEMAKEISGLKVLNRDEGGKPNEDATALVSFAMVVPLKQIIYVRKMNEGLAIIIGTAMTAYFEELAPLFEQSAQSVHAPTPRQ